VSGGAQIDTPLARAGGMDERTSYELLRFLSLLKVLV